MSEKHEKTRLEEIKAIVETVLRFEDDYLELSGALKGLHEIYVGITGIRGDRFEEGHDRDTITRHGKAISPNGAAFCLFELKRTVEFLKGMRDAFDAVLERFPGERIEILYAGCGPYGLLVLPLLPFYDHERMAVTLVDIHEESLDAVKRVIREWRLEPYIREVLQGDATSPELLPADRRFHLLVTETMLQALRTEPQVAVTLNLSRHLVEGGILVPERIGVEAALLNYAILYRWMMRLNPPEDDEPIPESGEEAYIPLRELIRLDLELARGYDAEYRERGEVDFPWVEVAIPDHPEGFSRLELRTFITVFGDRTLSNRDSSITSPLEVKKGVSFDPAQAGATIRFRYRMGANPGFVHEG